MIDVDFVHCSMIIPFPRLFSCPFDSHCVVQVHSFRISVIKSMEIYCQTLSGTGSSFSSFWRRWLHCIRLNPPRPQFAESANYIEYILIGLKNCLAIKANVWSRPGCIRVINIESCIFVWFEFIGARDRHPSSAMES
jgi:hypothetical protein